MAYTIGTKSRLALALDTLDSVQAFHASDLEAEVKAKERLRDKVSRYLDIAKVAEIERDELRDAVLELTEKVEVSNHDFTSWAHSRMRIPRLLDPIERMPNDFSNIASEDSLWSYASGMIRYLRGSLECERRAHAETRQAARAHISLLEAQLARQDAELEICTMHAARPHASSRLQSANHPNIPVFPPSPPIPNSDMNAFLEHTSAQNVLLEKEVEQLTARLEQARLAPKNAVLPQSTSGSAIGDIAQMPSRSPSSEHRPRARRNSQDNRADLKLHTSSSRRRTSISPARRNRPPSPGDPLTEAVDPDRTIHPDPTFAVHATENVHAAMDRELAVLGAKIEAFHMEKETLLAQVHAESQAEAHSRSHAHARSDSHHPEDQREPRPHTRHENRVPIVPDPVVQSSAENVALAPAQLHPLEDYDGEMSMDLATPLIATVILPMASASTFFHPSLPRPPTPGAPPAEISPLDLTSERPLPPAPSPPRQPRDRQTSPNTDPGPQLQPGEQAVQELMGIATLATARRRGS
ncbi:hypothetical protein DFH09DRAFT_391604 [Mycena vulgaris]|nr:hypothetical protein DFH09DRAFT_391604 [Mycena vulgaris]